MKVVYKNMESKKSLTWKDINEGDVCEFEDHFNCIFYGMKVYCVHPGCWLVNFSKNLPALYRDGDTYKILRKINDATLIIDAGK